jgi:predicted nucleic acid-binding protein
LAKEDVEVFLAQVEQDGLLAAVKPLKFHLQDPDDESFLEVALAAMAKAIVTGNKRHFSKREYEGVKILSPAEFLELLKGKV